MEIEASRTKTKIADVTIFYWTVLGGYGSTLSELEERSDFAAA